MRTIRIGVLNLSLTLGISFGVSLSGIFFKKLGFYGVYSICSTLYLMGIIYGFVCLKDNTKNVVSQVDKSSTEKLSLFSRIRDFFDLKHLTNAFRVTFKKDTDNRRLRIIMMMIVLMLIMGPLTGEQIILLYIYIQLILLSTRRVKV